MATQNKELARQLLIARPQLPKALFQVLIIFLGREWLCFSDLVSLSFSCLYYQIIKAICIHKHQLHSLLYAWFSIYIYVHGPCTPGTSRGFVLGHPVPIKKIFMFMQCRFLEKPIIKRSYWIDDV